MMEFHSIPSRGHRIVPKNPNDTNRSDPGRVPYSGRLRNPDGEMENTEPNENRTCGFADKRRYAVGEGGTCTRNSGPRIRNVSNANDDKREMSSRRLDEHRKGSAGTTTTTMTVAATAMTTGHGINTSQPRRREMPGETVNFLWRRKKRKEKERKTDTAVLSW